MNRMLSTINRTSEARNRPQSEFLFGKVYRRGYRSRNTNSQVGKGAVAKYTHVAVAAMSAAPLTRISIALRFLAALEPTPSGVQCL